VASRTPPDPLALLDEAIRSLEAERQIALPVLARAKGVEAESVFKAVKLLDDKLAEARVRRIQLVNRQERVARMQQIKEAMRAAREEAERRDLSPLRREELRKQIEVLQSEGAALVAESRRAREA
jgi:hypothetical protein